MLRCPECKRTKVNKIGIVVTRTGKRQRFKCQDCGRTFYIKKGE